LGDRPDPVQAYLDALPPDRKAALTKVRVLVRELAPRAVEGIQYKMPTYSVGDGYVAGFASQKQYMSLYVDTDAVERHRQALSVRGIDLGKGCIRFRRYEALPLDAVRAVIAESYAVHAEPQT